MSAVYLFVKDSMDKGRDGKIISQIVYSTESLWNSDHIMIIKANSNYIHFYRGNDIQGTARSTLVTSTCTVFTHLQIGVIMIAPLRRCMKYRELFSNLRKITWLGETRDGI